MATLNVYNRATDSYFNINVTVENAVIKGTGDGGAAFYVRVDTTRRSSTGEVIPSRIITTTALASTRLTEVIQQAISDIIEEVSALASSSSSLSSSESTVAMPSSQSSSLSSISSSLSTAALPSSLSSLSSESSESSLSSESSSITSGMSSSTPGP